MEASRRRKRETRGSSQKHSTFETHPGTEHEIRRAVADHLIGEVDVPACGRKWVVGRGSVRIGPAARRSGFLGNAGWWPPPAPHRSSRRKPPSAQRWYWRSGRPSAAPAGRTAPWQRPVGVSAAARIEREQTEPGLHGPLQGAGFEVDLLTSCSGSAPGYRALPRTSRRPPAPATPSFSACVTSPQGGAMGHPLCQRRPGRRWQARCLAP